MPDKRKQKIPLTRAKAYDDLRKMRGKVKFSINLKELRKDKILHK